SAGPPVHGGAAPPRIPCPSRRVAVWARAIRPAGRTAISQPSVRSSNLWQITRLRRRRARSFDCARGPAPLRMTTFVAHAGTTLAVHDEVADRRDHRT